MTTGYGQHTSTSDVGSGQTLVSLTFVDAHGPVAVHDVSLPDWSREQRRHDLRAGLCAAYGDPRHIAADQQGGPDDLGRPRAAAPR